MNRRARMCLFIALGALGCSSTSDTEGSGGSKATGHTRATSAASESGPKDCKDQGIGCGACCISVHAAGAHVYAKLVNCVLCSECPEDCSGTTAGSCKADSPEGSGKCDGKGVCSDADNDVGNDCSACATAPDGPCDTEVQSCGAQPECSAYYACISACP